jgi:saccharopine dehydrogenase-like NADP-dependent oxidoreductase
MKRVVLLGAGLVAGPVVRHLSARGVTITIAANNPQRARQLLHSGRDRSGQAGSGQAGSGQVVDWQADDRARLVSLLSKFDSPPLVISLLPAAFHPSVARVCIDHGCHLVTASYTSEEMWSLDEAAKNAGITLLNEIGLDPGIDHMSAMQLLDRIRERGSEVLSFRSYCGGLPAPEAADNPLRYKFSWSPEGVLRATLAAARYLEDGREVVLSAEEVPEHRHHVAIEGLGELEAYANRDSLDYREIYRLDQVETLYRGTLRYPGWCETISALRSLGLLSTEPAAAKSWREILAAALDCRPADVDAQLAERHSAQLGSLFSFLGLLRDDSPLGDAVPLAALARVMSEKMPFAEGERDLVVMHHEVTEKRPDKTRVRHLASLQAYGDSDPAGDTAMAKTVGLPVAIAAALLIDGRLAQKGVCIPVQKTIYDPVLAELAGLGIALDERTEAFEARALGENEK